jgi:hypothetical protein
MICISRRRCLRACPSADGRLAAAGFPHQPQAFAAPDGKRHSIHGLHLAGHPPQHAAAHRKVSLKVLDHHQILATVAGHPRLLSCCGTLRGPALSSLGGHHPSSCSVSVAPFRPTSPTGTASTAPGVPALPAAARVRSRCTSPARALRAPGSGARTCSPPAGRSGWARTPGSRPAGP